MSYRLRYQLAQNLLDVLTKRGIKPPPTISPGKLSRFLFSRNATKNFDSETAQFALNEKLLCQVLEIDDNSRLKEIREKTMNKDNIDNKNIVIKIDNGTFAKSIIKDVLSEKDEYARGFENHKYVRTKNGVFERPGPEKVIVEFGSPNVAKPLHAGHLRSAVIGRFVASINQALGNSVVKMNYLGDWGTQFGLLAVGYRKFGNKKDLECSPMKHLFEVYVKVNDLVEKQGLEGETYREVRDYMRLLERRKPHATTLWRKFRDVSIDWSTETFRRLGIEFDEIEFESDFITKSRELCDDLESRDSLRYDDENVGFIQHDDTKIILRKSDGSSLYLSRDIAAILNRFDRYGFDRIHYVVDSSQNAHFQKMKKVLELLGSPLANQDNLHIPFGRVRGMSTRRGNIIHLDEVLDEARQRMLQIITTKTTTKTENMEFTAENLGLSAVFIQDLKERRQKDYDFDWDRMLGNKGATGPFLQYGHARLSSLEAQFPKYLEEEANFNVLCEPQAVRLLQHLSKFDQILNECYYTLEPHTLVHYLLDLVTISNHAVKNLNIKNSSEEVACARVQLFSCTRSILSNGIRIFGLEPLREM